MLQVKIFRKQAEALSIEDQFNAWSNEADMKIATAQFVAGENDVEKLIVFYEEKTFSWPKAPSVAEAEVLAEVLA
jgi:hypothetical protein